MATSSSSMAFEATGVSVPLSCSDPRYRSGKQLQHASHTNMDEAYLGRDIAANGNDQELQESFGSLQSSSP